MKKFYTLLRNKEGVVFKRRDNSREDFFRWYESSFDVKSDKPSREIYDILSQGSDIEKIIKYWESVLS